MPKIEPRKKSEVATSIQRMIERAEKAMEQKNHSYACDMLRNALLIEPGLTEARLNLRQAQLEKIGMKSNILRQAMASFTTAWPILVKGPMLLKKQDYAKALDTAEKAMEKDPTILSTLHFLKKAGVQAGLIEVGVNAMEIAIRFHPKHRNSYKALAEVYQEQGQATKSVQILQKLQSLKPSDAEVQGQLKHAAALAAMEDGKWEKADSYRDLIKDKDLAQTLEQEERIAVHDEETRDRLIQKTLDKIEAGEATAGDYRKVAELYRQGGKYDEAIDKYQKIFELTGSVDPGIEGAITDTIREKYDLQLADLADEIEKQPDKKDELQKQIQDIEAERDRVLLERLQKRVQDYPNEMQYRFELGMAYWKDDQWDAALNEFQQARRNPHIANKARLYMAKCLMAKNLTDLAIENLQEALQEKDKLNSSILKEVMYDLACAYQQNGDDQKALATWKELYGLDVNYSDVGKRLEAYYQK